MRLRLGSSPVEDISSRVYRLTGQPCRLPYYSASEFEALPDKSPELHSALSSAGIDLLGTETFNGQEELPHSMLRYSGSAHLFADSSLPDYESDAARLRAIANAGVPAAARLTLLTWRLRIFTNDRTIAVSLAALQSELTDQQSARAASVRQIFCRG